jgi:hypothetical protein
MSRSALIHPVLVAALILGASHVMRAQSAPTAKKHPAVCAQGVRVYTDKSQVPAPHDTLTIPPGDGPVRVSSPEEAEAAELALRGRAGSVGATGILVTDVTSEEGGGTRVQRSVTAFYVAADAARAQQACKK